MICDQRKKIPWPSSRPGNGGGRGTGQVNSSDQNYTTKTPGVNGNQAVEALEVLRGAGLSVDSIDFDGRLHRVPTAGKPGSKDGAYVAHADSPMTVWWQDHRTGETGVWTAKGQGKLTMAERETLAKRREEDQLIKEAEQSRVHTEAASRAQAIYAAASGDSAAENPYLLRKGVKPVPGLVLTAEGMSIGGITFPPGALIVPAYDEGGAVATLQFIDGDGNKRFLAGGRKRGCCFPIGGKEPGKPLLICEGLSTALSLHGCLALPVLVAFDAGNLLPVAELARRCYPDREIVLCADFDESTEQHPSPGGIGVAKATEAARAVVGYLAIPSMDGAKSDFNDLHLAKGVDEVRRQFADRAKPGAEDDLTNRTNGIDIANSDDREDHGESSILPPPPPVPIEAFPPRVAALLKEAAEAFTAPLQIPVACLLGMLSCLVGGARLISLRSSWREPGNIWIATVAASGIGKSPCATAFFKPIADLEHEAFKGWQNERMFYECALDEYQRDRRKADASTSLIPPEAPARRQGYVDDATIESVGAALQDNAKGILWKKDELSGLIADMDKYSKSSGGTRARLLSSYDGGEWKTNRTSDPRRNLHIRNAYVSIFGGIQPAMLAQVFETGAAGADEASGFLQRFIMIRAEREQPSYWTETSLSPESIALLEDITKILWSWDIEHDDQGRPLEKVVPVTAQAKSVFIAWFNGIAREEFLATNASLLSKLKGQAMRLCLLLHCLDAALAKTDGMEPVTESTMRRALLLADWVKTHQAQCWQFFGKVKQVNPIERAVMRVVVEEAARIEADGWRISNERLFSLVEKRLGMPGMSPVKLGKAAAVLGLPGCWITPKERGRTITRKTISNFNSSVGSVGSVGWSRDLPTEPTEPTVVLGNNFQKGRSPEPDPGCFDGLDFPDKVEL